MLRYISHSVYINEKKTQTKILVWLGTYQKMLLRIYTNTQPKKNRWQKGGYIYPLRTGF